MDDNVDDLFPDELFPDVHRVIGMKCPNCGGDLLTDGENKWCMRIFVCQWGDGDELTST